MPAFSLCFKFCARVLMPGFLGATLMVHGQRQPSAISRHQRFCPLPMDLCVHRREYSKLRPLIDSPVLLSPGFCWSLGCARGWPLDSGAACSWHGPALTSPTYTCSPSELYPYSISLVEPTLGQMPELLPLPVCRTLQNSLTLMMSLGTSISQRSTLRANTLLIPEVCPAC